MSLGTGHARFRLLDGDGILYYSGRFLGGAGPETPSALSTITACPIPGAPPSSTSIPGPASWKRSKAGVARPLTVRRHGDGRAGQRSWQAALGARPGS